MPVGFLVLLLLICVTFPSGWISISSDSLDRSELIAILGEWGNVSRLKFALFALFSSYSTFMFTVVEVRSIHRLYPNYFAHPARAAYFFRLWDFLPARKLTFYIFLALSLPGSSTFGTSLGTALHSELRMTITFGTSLGTALHSELRVMFTLPFLHFEKPNVYAGAKRRESIFLSHSRAIKTWRVKIRLEEWNSGIQQKFW
ncbi:hypothetical protein C8J57DRAFT_1262435 [Mycena rebaudengoi]|nr:hypothetical protein C8J57DRAFT_1262435 [Mycena rebaudengoi]